MIISQVIVKLTQNDHFGPTVWYFKRRNQGIGL